MNSTNCSNTTGMVAQPVLLRMSHWVFPPLSIAVNIVGPLLNILLLVICRRLQQRRRASIIRTAPSLVRSHNTTFFFTMKLALVNIILSLSLLPINVKLLRAVTITRMFCAAITVQRYFSLFLSFYILAFISAERCWAALVPLNPPLHQTLKKAAACVWLFCIVLAIPLPFLLKYQYVLFANNCRLARECETTLCNNAIGMYVLVLLIIPIILILIASILLLCKLRRVAAVKTYNTSLMVKTFRKAIAVTVATMVSILVSAAPMCWFILTTKTQTSETRRTYYSLYVLLSLHVISTPVITILGYQPIKEKFKRYIGLEKRHMYDFKPRPKANEGRSVILVKFRNFNTFSQSWLSFDDTETVTSTKA